MSATANSLTPSRMGMVSSRRSKTVEGGWAPKGAGFVAAVEMTAPSARAEQYRKRMGRPRMAGWNR